MQMWLFWGKQLFYFKIRGGTNTTYYSAKISEKEEASEHESRNGCKQS